MSTGLLKLIKQAALDAVKSGQPCDIRYGVVTSVNPLKIQLTPQFTLPDCVLVVPKRFTEDYEIKVEIDGSEKTIKLKNTLEVNDKVALLKQEGGQSYLVLDKI